MNRGLKLTNSSLALAKARAATRTDNTTSFICKGRENSALFIGFNETMFLI